MINIFVTYRCNLSCSYCFARELRQDFSRDMSAGDFKRLLGWMAQTGVPAAGVIGGEPTLHNNIVSMVREIAGVGTSVVLFTNALFDQRLVPELVPYVSNFVVNYNDPSLYRPEQYNRLNENLEQLGRSGARLTFSKNFTTAFTDYAYLLDAAERFGVEAIRYDLSRPSASGTNDYITAGDSRALLKKIVGFVRDCEAKNIRTGLDCCVQYCELSPDDRAYLERVSIKFKGICHPSVDIHPDLSASYCLPLKDVSVKDVTEFANYERLMHHFAATVRERRYESSPDECASCHDFRRKCQGGCMAVKRPGRRGSAGAAQALNVAGE